MRGNVYFGRIYLTQGKRSAWASVPGVTLGDATALVLSLLGLGAILATSAQLYEALKTYLMLYDPKHLDTEAVWRWYQTRSEQLLPGAGPDAQKTLKTHFDALYERGWVDPAVSRNDALVARVRAVVGRLDRHGPERLDPRDPRGGREVVEERVPAGEPLDAEELLRVEAAVRGAMLRVPGGRDAPPRDVEHATQCPPRLRTAGRRRRAGGR